MATPRAAWSAVVAHVRLTAEPAVRVRLTVGSEAGWAAAVAAAARNAATATGIENRRISPQTRDIAGTCGAETRQSGGVFRVDLDVAVAEVGEEHLGLESVARKPDDEL